MAGVSSRGGLMGGGSQSRDNRRSPIQRFFSFDFFTATPFFDVGTALCDSGSVPLRIERKPWICIANDRNKGMPLWKGIPKRGTV